MSCWHGDREGPGSDRGAATVLTVFQHQHLGRRDAKAFGGRQVDFRMRFAIGDVFAGQNELEPGCQLKTAEFDFCTLGGQGGRVFQ
jgi:hypothetical protein